MKLAKYLITPILKNICERLLLKFQNYYHEIPETDSKVKTTELSGKSLEIETTYLGGETESYDEVENFFFAF